MYTATIQYNVYSYTKKNWSEQKSELNTKARSVRQRHGWDSLETLGARSNDFTFEFVAVCRVDIES